MARGRGGGGFRGGRGGYRGNTRGFRGARGGFRGRGRRGRGVFRGGRGKGGRGASRVVQRWSEDAHPKLVNAVKHFNENDFYGPKRVRFYCYPNSPWEKVESLSKGKWYWSNKETKKTQWEMPDELIEIKELEEQTRLQKPTWARRPKSTWPESFKSCKVVTNCYPTEGSLLTTKIYLWSVQYDPPLDNNANEREMVFQGGRKASFQKKRENIRILEKTFGKYVHDNLMFYSTLNGGKTKFVLKELHPEYTVTFTQTDCVELNSNDMPQQQQDQILNIFTRDLFQIAGYKKYQREAYFKDGTAGNFERQCEIVEGHQGRDSLAILKGFEAKMKTSNPKGCHLKVDLFHKLLFKDTLHQQIERIKLSCQSDEEFRIKVEKRFKNKYFILNYGSKRSERIEEFDWTCTENSPMSPENPIPFKQYFKEKYGVKSDRKEYCLVRTRAQNGFLPQHIHLTVVSDECKDIYDKAMNIMSTPIGTRMKKIQVFIDEVTKSHELSRKKKTKEEDEDGQASSADFKVNRNPSKIDALQLPYPKIIMQTRNGQQEFDVQELPQAWGRNTAGYLQPLKKLQKWVIICGHGKRWSAENVVQRLEDYIKKRGFVKGNPWTKPHIREVDFNRNEEYGRYTSKDEQYALVLLPEGIKGSEIKVRFTKATQMSRQSTSIHVQFLKEHNCHQNTKVWGAFEDMMSKWGNTLFRINPGLNEEGAKFINVDRTWVAGLDISHNGTKKPSVATLSLSTDPLSGSLANVRHKIHLNPPRKECLAYDNMVNLFEAMLISVWRDLNKRWKNEAVRHLPAAIWVFRDGISDGQLKECYSKEVNGIQRACRKFAADFKIRHPASKKKKDWCPKVQFIVAQKRILDRFGELMSDGSVREPKKATIIFDYVLSNVVWDFIAWFNTRGKNRPLRYIVVLDELKLYGNHAAVRGMFQFIFALTYTYPFSIPFAMGNTNQPASIKLAKHYCDSWSQQILSTDHDLRQLETSPNLNRPQLSLRQYAIPMVNDPKPVGS